MDLFSSSHFISKNDKFIVPFVEFHSFHSFERVQETVMELELKEEGASFYVEEYGLLVSRFHRVFNYLNLQSSVGLSTQDVSLSLQKEVLKGNTHKSTSSHMYTSV